MHLIKNYQCFKMQQNKKIRAYVIHNPCLNEQFNLPTFIKKRIASAVSFSLEDEDFIGLIVTDFTETRDLENFLRDFEIIQCELHLDVEGNPFAPLESTEEISAIIKLKDNSRPQMLKWSNSLNTLMPTAQLSVAHDGIARETWFSFQYKGHDFLYGHMKKLCNFSPIASSRNDFQSTDSIHQNFKRYWDKDNRVKCKKIEI